MRSYFQGTAKDGNGKVIAGATVSVFLAGTDTPASIYTTFTGATAVNSVVSATEGTSNAGYFNISLNRTLPPGINLPGVVINSKKEL